MACRQQLAGKKICETFGLEQKCRATKIHQFCPSDCLKVKGHVCTMVPFSMEQTLRQFVGWSNPKGHQRTVCHKKFLLLLLRQALATECYAPSNPQKKCPGEIKPSQRYLADPLLDSEWTKQDVW